MSDHPTQSFARSEDPSGASSGPAPENERRSSSAPSSDSNRKAWLLIGCLGTVAVLAICTVVGGIAYLIAGDSDDAVSSTPTVEIAREATPEPTPTTAFDSTPNPTPEQTPTLAPTQEITPTPGSTPTTEPTSTAEPDTDPTPIQQDESGETARGFGDGTHVIGEDIEPGIYFANDPDEGCYWERMSGFSGELDDIIANQFTDDRQIVVIEETDVAFTSTRCGRWETEPGDVRADPISDLDDGIYLVGDEIEPGTWRSEGSDGTCYWARLDGFSGELDDILANGFGGVGDIVEIRDTDAGFESSYCGPWVRIGD